MSRGPKGSYTKGLRQQAVKLVLVEGLSQREAAGRLSLSVKTLGAWVVAERKARLAKVGKTQALDRLCPGIPSCNVTRWVKHEDCVVRNRIDEQPIALLDRDIKSRRTITLPFVSLVTRSPWGPP
uniref:transposase n=1 Tax=Paraburkholderia sediminicola TaxID=458836 RepID=UPI0038B860C4